MQKALSKKAQIILQFHVLYYYRIKELKLMYWAIPHKNRFICYPNNISCFMAFTVFYHQLLFWMCINGSLFLLFIPLSSKINSNSWICCFDMLLLPQRWHCFSYFTSMPFLSELIPFLMYIFSMDSFPPFWIYNKLRWMLML